MWTTVGVLAAGQGVERNMKKKIINNASHLDLVGQVHEDFLTPLHGQRGAGTVDRVQLLSVVRRHAAIARAQLGLGAPHQFAAHGRRRQQTHRERHGERDGRRCGRSRARLGHRTSPCISGRHPSSEHGPTGRRRFDNNAAAAVLLSLQRVNGAELR